MTDVGFICSPDDKIYRLIEGSFLELDEEGNLTDVPMETAFIRNPDVDTDGLLSMYYDQGDPQASEFLDRAIESENTISTFRSIRQLTVGTCEKITKQPAIRDMVDHVGLATPDPTNPKAGSVAMALIDNSNIVYFGNSNKRKKQLRKLCKREAQRGSQPRKQTPPASTPGAER